MITFVIYLNSKRKIRVVPESLGTGGRVLGFVRAESVRAARAKFGLS